MLNAMRRRNGGGVRGAADARLDNGYCTAIGTSRASRPLPVHQIWAPADTPLLLFRLFACKLFWSTLSIPRSTFTTSHHVLKKLHVVPRFCYLVVLNISLEALNVTAPPVNLTTYYLRTGEVTKYVPRQ